MKKCKLNFFSFHIVQSNIIELDIKNDPPIYCNKNLETVETLASKEKKNNETKA